MFPMRDFFLTTERIGFSVWTAADLPAAIELWGNPAVTRFYYGGRGCRPAQIESRLEQEIETYRTDKVQYWPIYLRESGEHIGCCGLRPHDPGQKILAMGFHLKDTQWGKGLAREAANAVIVYAFDVLGVHALFAGHNPLNKASERLLKKTGLRLYA